VSGGWLRLLAVWLVIRRLRCCLVVRGRSGWGWVVGCMSGLGCLLRRLMGWWLGLGRCWVGR
jgi:hypothetical protein